MEANDLYDQYQAMLRNLNHLKLNAQQKLTDAIVLEKRMLPRVNRNIKKWPNAGDWKRRRESSLQNIMALQSKFMAIRRSG